MSFVWEKTDFISTTLDSIQRVDLTFPNNIGPSIYSSQQTKELTNFYTEHFPNGLISNRSFDRIIYNDLYKNIDLHYYSYEDGIKLYYVIKPGGDPTDIIMDIDGAITTNINTSAGLEISSFQDQLKFKKAIVQTVDFTGTIGSLTNSGSFFSSGTDQYQIVVEPSDPTHFVVITIEQDVVKKPNGSGDIEWSTYFGGNLNTTADAMDVDLTGNFYVSGTSSSTNFPGSPGVFNQFMNGGLDGYLARFNNDYSKTWLTYFGGDGFERPSSIAYDNLNNVVYVSGMTNSSLGTFTSQIPTFNTSAYVDGNIAQKPNFIQRFNTVGQREWSTFYEGTPVQTANSDLITSKSIIKVDDIGRVYCATNVTLTGPAGSNNISGVLSNVPLTNGEQPICFPTTNSYHQLANNISGVTSRDILLMNFDANLNLIWSTFIGGTSANDLVYDMAIDDANDLIYLVGSTSSSAGDPCSSTGANGFPICTQNFYYQDQIYGPNDGFITRFTLDGVLNYSTFFGGANNDEISGITLNFPGDFFITGNTNSSTYSSTLCSSNTNGLFPNCPNGGYTQPYGGLDSDAFVARFRSATTLLWSTFFGGSGFEGSTFGVGTVDQKIALNDDGDLFLYGNKYSTGVGFPVLPSVIPNDGYFFESNSASSTETYIARFSSSHQLLWCTYYGGDLDDFIGEIVPFEDRLYICGSTYSQNNLPYNCPSTVNPYCQPQKGNIDRNNGFIANLRYDPSVVGISDEIMNSHNSETSTFILIPNPTLDHSKVYVYNDILENTLVEIKDQFGKTLYTKFYDVVDKKSDIILDFSNFSPGLYYVNLTDKNSSSSKKIVKL